MIDTTGNLPLARMLAVFVGILLTANIAIMALTYYAPDFAIPNSLGLVFVMAAAMAAGQTAAPRLGRRMTAREKAIFAAGATILSIIMVVLLMSGLLAYSGVEFSLQNLVLAMTAEILPPQELWAALPWVLLFASALSFLVTYGFVGWGVSSQLKALEKKAARDAARGR